MRTLKYFLLLVLVSISFDAGAQVKILFDATKAETAGNADWVIDADQFNLSYSSGPATTGGNEANAQRIPTPAQSGITASTPESYWTGALSSWGIDCVKKGYTVETLPYNGRITYGDGTNAQDLSNYKVFIVCEPNIVFTSAEKAALLNFVSNGGGLFMVSDHDVSDRNGDGWDSPHIWNDFLTNNGIINNPFGITFDYANFSGSSSNIPALASDSLLHGPMGSVTQVLWSNGTSMTLSAANNSSVKGVVYKTGSSFGSTNVMCAYARYGLGKVVAIGDSSPCDDGSGDPNDALYDGYISDAAGNHQKLLMNATIWLATTNTAMPIHFISFDVKLQNNTTITLNWNTSETNAAAGTYNIERSYDGRDFKTIGSVQADNQQQAFYHYKDNGVKSGKVYYRIGYAENGQCALFSPVEMVTIFNTSVQLYPNPVTEKAVIRFDALPNDADLFLYDERGAVMQKIRLHAGSDHQSISISNLPKGLYIISIVSKNAPEQQRALLIQ